MPSPNEPPVLPDDDPLWNHIFVKQNQAQGGVPLDQDPVWGDVMSGHFHLDENEQVKFYPQDSRSFTPSMYVYPCGDDTGFSFQNARHAIADQLREAPRIQRGTWQTMDVSGSDLHITRELMNYALVYHVPPTREELVFDVQPDMPWADEHFAERVSRKPLNPPPSHVNWPYHGSDKERHLDDNEIFSHTYPERFWPKRANPSGAMHFENGRRAEVNTGIRFAYGDLDGVVNQLVANPLTRQAYLPVWFPEDTGATDRRVPCTLGYHFMADDNLRLHCWYSLRACDFVRHFHNDVYFAARLLQWVCEEVQLVCGYQDNDLPTFGFTPGNLNMTISSLHAFEGDMEKLP